VSIGEDAIANSNDGLLDDYYTDDYKLHSPAGAFNRDEIKAYFAALRNSFTDFTISRAQILVDGNFVTARTVMAGRFDKEFVYTPLGAVEPKRPTSAMGADQHLPLHRRGARRRGVGPDGHVRLPAPARRSRQLTIADRVGTPEL